MGILWTMVSQDKRAITMEKNIAELSKGGPVHSPKYCSTRKGHHFDEYFKLVHADKRAFKSAYRIIIEHQSDSDSVDSYHCESHSKYTDDAYHAYCCVHTLVCLWYTQLPLLLLEHQNRTASACTS